MSESYSVRQKLELLRAQLDNERSTFKAHWRDLSDYIRPRRARFFTSDRNKGDKRNQKIIDPTGTMASRTLRSGMMSGVTSPARPWFRLATTDPDLAEFGPVRQWLHDTADRMNAVFIKSNLYNVLPILYGDMGDFATASMFMEEDFTGEVVRFYPFPIGSYMIAQNDKLEVDVFFREFEMTVRQIVSRFAKRDSQGNIDWSNISTHVRHMWEQKNTEAWVQVCHAIVPNDDYNPNKIEAKFKKFSSVYYEQGATNTNGSQTSMTGGADAKILSQSGYDYFPALCPRWEVSGEDVYGTDCPGMTVLGDIKQLQLGEKRVAQAIEKMVNPPMVGSTILRTAKASILPGDITYVDERAGLQGFRPAHEINFNVQAVEGKQEQIRNRIKRGYYEDLFLMLASSDRRQITAREIDERHEEKLLALGPVLEQLNQDLLDPLIDNTFAIMLKQGLIPPAPEELNGMTLKVEYISIMAQAQKLVGVGSIERFTGFVSNVASVNPETLDKLDLDQLIDVYGDLTSIPPGIVRTDDDAQAIRAQRAQAQQAQAQIQAVGQASSAAKNLSQTDMTGDNALNRLLGVASGE